MKKYVIAFMLMGAVPLAFADTRVAGPPACDCIGIGITKVQYPKVNAPLVPTYQAHILKNFPVWWAMFVGMHLF